jgi:hypothetical protein
LIDDYFIDDDDEEIISSIPALFALEARNSKIIE